MMAFQKYGRYWAIQKQKMDKVTKEQILGHVEI
jgi:hypothetical protein